MSAADDIIDVQISLLTQVAAEANFGMPLIAGYHSHFPELSRLYSDLDGMVTDGFATTEPEYLAAAAMLTQNPTITQFKVGRRTRVYTKTWRLIPTDTTQGIVYKGSIQGEDFTYTVDGDDTVATIIDGLKTAIDALSGITVTTTDNTTSLDVAVAAGVWYRWAGINKEMTIEDRTANPGSGGVASDLSAIEAADPDWYGLILDSESKAETVAAADWVATRVKMFLANTIDSACMDSGSTSDVMYTLHNTDEPRASVWYHGDTGEFLCAAIMAYGFARDPGAITWSGKSLEGVTADTFTAAQRSAITNKKGNLYTACRGLSMTRFGTMANGEYIDVIHGVDWLADIIQADLVTYLAQRDKVPFTDAGIQGVKGRILGQLQRGIDAGVLAADPAPTVTVPLAKNVSAADKAARTLTGVTFLGTLAGAIHYVQVRGTLTA